MFKWGIRNFYQLETAVLKQFREEIPISEGQTTKANRSWREGATTKTQGWTRNTTNSKALNKEWQHFTKDKTRQDNSRQDKAQG